MELPKRSSKNMLGDQRDIRSKEIHKSKSDSQTILSESKPSSSPEDVIMSDENWSYETQAEDSLMFDESYASNTNSSTTTIHHPSSEIEHPASSSDKRYVSTPRRYRGILDPREAAEDAAFFARANRRYRQGIQNIFREDERKAKENFFGTAERKKVVSIAKARAASSSSSAADGKTINFVDIF